MKNIVQRVEKNIFLINNKLKEKKDNLRSNFLNVFFCNMIKMSQWLCQERRDVFIEKKHKVQLNEKSEKVIELTIQDLFAETIEWLIDCYRETGEENYMEAVERIQWVCNTISDRVCLVQLIKVDKNEIRRVLRRWPKTSKKESDPDWVADDIMNRIVNQIKGRKYYQKGKNPQAFEVVISEKKAFLLDLERQVIYLFETKKE